MYPRIRNLREDRDLTQTKLSSLLRCTQACYSNYENGRRDIPTDILIQLALELGTSTDYLLGLTDVRSPYPRSRQTKRNK